MACDLGQPASSATSAPEAADEADVERRAVVERWTGLAEVRRPADRRPASSASSARVVVLAGRRRGRPAVRRSGVLVLAEAGDDVAQRGELGGDRVAALGHPVDLGAERGQLALASRRRRWR